MKAQFTFRCAYLNSTWFDVRDETGCYQIEYRSRTSDYERSIYNGPPEEYEAQCGAIVGWLKATCRSIPPATVRAYNEWRLEKATEANEKLDRLEIPQDDPLRQPQLIAKGAVEWAADGWRFEPIEQPITSAAA